MAGEPVCAWKLIGSERLHIDADGSHFHWSLWGQTEAVQMGCHCLGPRAYRAHRGTPEAEGLCSQSPLFPAAKPQPPQTGQVSAVRPSPARRLHLQPLHSLWSGPLGSPCSPFHPEGHSCHHNMATHSLVPSLTHSQTALEGPPWARPQLGPGIW